LDAIKRATAAMLVIQIADLSGDSKLVLEAYKWVSERFEKVNSSIWNFECSLRHLV
jgi:hypothetical protein